MQKALELARLGEGYVNPNPMVGAVLVKNGRIISTGYHKKYGLGMQKEWLLKIVKLL
jgi:diaminohydroxyphosphoribosylaminopyrimidine deaminase/5-amino-6-(5-phosphoribosylamino)uracil reductase